MAHTLSEDRTPSKKRKDNKHHRVLVPVAHPESWEEGMFEWHSSSIHTNSRYFEDLSWKAATRAPKQWARHKKKGVGPLDLKRSLDHWYTDEDGRMPSGRQNGQVLIGWEQFRTHLEILEFESEFV